MTISPITLGNSFNKGGTQTVLGGFSSGLDTKSVIDAIVAAQTTQVTSINDKITVNSSQATALTSLSQILTQLKSAVSLISSPQSPDPNSNLWAVNTSNVTSNTSQPASNFLTTSVTSGTAAGTYTISNISQLASASTQQSAAFSVSPSATPIVIASGAVSGQFNAGTFTVHGPGGDASVTFTTGDKLNDVANDFNLVNGTTDLSASVVQTSTGIYTLKFTRTSTGNPVTFDLTSNSNITADPSGVFDAQGSASFTLDPATHPYVLASGAGSGQFNAGVITIAGPSGTASVTITTGDTLSNVVNDFNAVKATTGITASLLQTSPGVYKLVFKSNTTGQNTTFDLSSPGTVTSDISGVLTHISFAAAIGGLDANFKLNNVNITRSTNTFSDLISGVTFNLLQDTTSVPTANFTLQIAPDISSIRQGIDNFVTAYNSFLTFYAQQTQVDSTGIPATTAVLNSDTTLRSIYSQITNIASSIVQGISSGSNKLTDVGISVTDTPATTNAPAVANTLSVDDAALQSALLSDFTGVQKVFGAVLNSSSSNLALFQSTTHSTVQSFVLDVNQSGALYTNGGAIVVASGADTGEFNAGTFTISGPGGSGDVTLNTGNTLDDIAAAFNAVNGTTDLTATVETASAGVYKLVFTRTSTGDPVTFSLTSPTYITSDSSGVLSKQQSTGYIATYTDPLLGVQHLALTAGSLGTGGVVLSAPTTGGALDGLRMIYASTGNESDITVTLSQGIADQINGFATSALKTNTGLIALDRQALQTKTTSYQTQVTTINTQIDNTRQQLLQKYAALEAAINSANSVLNLLNAQQLVNSGGH